MKAGEWLAIIKDTAKGWSDDNAARLGAALAFYSILSLGPLLLLVLAAASWFWGHDAAQGRIVSQMTGIVGQSGAEAIKSILDSSSKSPDASLLATLFGFATLLFSASGAFGELQGAMNIVWKVKLEDRPWHLMIRDRLFSFLMVVGSGVVIMTSFFLSTILSAFSGYLDHMLRGASALGHATDFLISLGVITLLFAVTFKAVPDRPIEWNKVRFPAFVTAVLFVVGKMAIAFYIGHAGIGSGFGAAGSVVILLVWIYYSSQIIFFGAEFAYAYAQRLDGRSQPLMSS